MADIFKFPDRADIDKAKFAAKWRAIRARAKANRPPTKPKKQKPGYSADRWDPPSRVIKPDNRVDIDEALAVVDVDDQSNERRQEIVAAVLKALLDHRKVVVGQNGLYRPASNGKGPRHLSDAMIAGVVNKNIAFTKHGKRCKTPRWLAAELRWAGISYK